jgi:hypothetical protein
MAELFVALLHHPVLDRRERVIASAITSLDIHDLARSALTYGVRTAYVVHPVPEQRAFASTVIDHWITGQGRVLDARRQRALRLIEVVADLDEAIDDATLRAGARPLLVLTSARTNEGLAYDVLRQRIEGEGAPVMLLFGTGFGLAPALAQRADVVLSALRGPTDYNHLSVRAASAIILDRLRGR